jgi:hypothetical protein
MRAKHVGILLKNSSGVPDVVGTPSANASENPKASVTMLPPKFGALLPYCAKLPLGRHANEVID